MRISSALASGARHTIGVAAQGFLVAAMVAALVLAVAPTLKPANALAGNGNGGGGSTSQSWITLNSSTGSATTAALPTLGGWVSFATGYPGNIKNPRIEVLCSQNGSLVYGEAGSVDHSFLLGGGWSLWLGSGGSADCVANLFYFGQRAGSQTYNLLATTSFAAAG